MIPASSPGDRVRMTAVLVHYSEVALKGKNARGSWPPGPQHSRALAGLHSRSTQPIGRIEVGSADQVMPEVLDRLSRIFGIHNYSVYDADSLDFEAGCAIVSRLPPKNRSRAFGCSCVVPIRNPIPSPDLARDLGSRFWTARAEVDPISRPVISVEIIPVRRAATWSGSLVRAVSGGTAAGGARFGRH